MSQLGNSPQQVTSLRLEARRSYALGLKFIDKKTNAPVDITGATIKMTVREPKRWGGDIVLATFAEFIGATVLGVAQLNIQAADTDGLNPATYTFTITLDSVNHYMTTVLKGELELVGNDEPDVTSEFPTVTPSTTLAAYLEHGDVVQVMVDKVDGPTSAISLMLADAGDLVADAQSAASAAAASATTANTKAVAAAASATAAAGSATTATTKANAAAADAGTANNSKNAAAISETNAAKSAVSAAGSADLAAGAAVKGGQYVTQARGYRDEAETFKNAAQAAAAGVSGDVTGVVESSDFDLHGDWDFTLATVHGLGAGTVTDVNGEPGPHVVLDQGDITDTATKVAMLATERIKLGGIADGATANRPDLNLLTRNNHLGTQSADTITDGTTNKAFLATERTKLSGIATGATANDTDANLKARANHTGTQSADTLTDGTTNKAFLATERTKLAGVATGATANDTDANLRDRSTHTGTNPLSSMPPGSVTYVVKDPTTGFWPASWSSGVPVYTGGSASAGVRPTSRADIVCIWKGPEPSPAVVTTGTGGARDQTGGALGDLRDVTT